MAEEATRNSPGRGAENAALYILTGLIWGSTWLAIKFQLGAVAPELSVAYRFGLASLLLFAYMAARGLRGRFQLQEHAFMALQGLFLFSLNYILVYLAEQTVTSGLVAVVFSAIILFNVGLGALLLGNPVSARVVVGALIGILGLALIFWPELAGLSLNGGKGVGLLLGIAAPALASLGNIISARNQRHGLPVVQTNAFGMLYGSLFMFLFAFLRGAQLTVDTSLGYLGSLMYLALFGSVIAFGSYLTLLGRIGPDRAAYVTVLFPVIALLLSAAFEDLNLHAAQLGGVGLVLLGNFFVLRLR